ncbi:MAG: ATP-binding protein [Motilibacteraceae bacterium]
MSEHQPPRSRHYVLPATVTSVTRARNDVRALLREWRLTAVEDDAALVVTELVGNAVRHGRGEVKMVVLLHDHHLRLEVHDAGQVVPVAAVASARTTRPEHEQGHGENGRGLRIVEALTERWGIVEHGSGLLAWCEMALPDAHRADATLHTLSDYRSDDRPERAELADPPLPAVAAEPGAATSGRARHIASA